MMQNIKPLLGTRLELNAPPPLPNNPAIVFCTHSSRNSTAFGIRFEDLSTHILLAGATGSGKTNAILHMIRQLKQIMTPDDVMLIFDTKNDFGRFQTNGDYLITNYNRPSSNIVRWNIFMDIVADGWGKSEIEANADELAQVIFTDSIAESNQPFFPSAARDIFSAILKAMCFLGIQDTDYRIRFLNNEALAKYLRNINAKRLTDFIGQFPELTGVLKYIGSGQSDQALGVFAELQAVTGRLFVKCFGKDGRFSIRKAERQKGGKALFVEYDASSGQSLQPIYRVLVDLFLKEALSPTFAKGHVYIICDELKMLPHLNHLEDALNFGRSLGIVVIAGIQSMEQLYEMYGEFGGKNIASGFQTTFCFRTNNAATREYIKSIHGQNVCTMQYLDYSNKPVEELRIGYAVEDWDISTLKRGEAIIGLPGQAPFKFYMERYG